MPSETLIKVAAYDHAVFTVPDKDNVTLSEALLLLQRTLLMSTLEVWLSDVVELICRAFVIC